jgi:regulatory protein
MSDRIDGLEPVDGKSTVQVRFGERTLEIAADAVRALGLVPGQVVSEALLGMIEAAADRRVAAARVLRYLRGRPRTAAEVRVYLERHGHPGATVEAVLADLQAKGIVDDGRYAAWFVRGRLAHRPTGARRLVREMTERGVPRALADAAAASAMDAADELELALAAARPRLAGLVPLGRERAMRRLAAFLARRGFREAVVREACLRLLAGARPDTGET